MLKTYEAMYQNGQIKWLAEDPQVSSARVIVTFLEETKVPLKHRSASAKIAGKGKTLSDLIGPIVDEQDWECLK